MVNLNADGNLMKIEYVLAIQYQKKSYKRISVKSDEKRDAHWVGIYLINFISIGGIVIFYGLLFKIIFGNHIKYQSKLNWDIDHIGQKHQGG